MNGLSSCIQAFHVRCQFCVSKVMHFRISNSPFGLVFLKNKEKKFEKQKSARQALAHPTHLHFCLGLHPLERYCTNSSRVRGLAILSVAEEEAHVLVLVLVLACRFCLLPIMTDDGLAPCLTFKCILYEIVCFIRHN